MWAQIQPSSTTGGKLAEWLDLCRSGAIQPPAQARAGCRSRRRGFGSGAVIRAGVGEEARADARITLEGVTTTVRQSTSTGSTQVRQFARVRH
jgi:hypothetical protein